MSALHTPGPWFRDKYGNVLGPNKNNIQFRSVSICCAGSGVDEAEANTNLIAAAPELLAALESAMEALTDVECDRNNIDTDAIAFAASTARAAIAKATGAA